MFIEIKIERKTFFEIVKSCIWRKTIESVFVECFASMVEEVGMKWVSECERVWVWVSVSECVWLCVTACVWEREKGREREVSEEKGRHTRKKKKRKIIYTRYVGYHRDTKRENEREREREWMFERVRNRPLKWSLNSKQLKSLPVTKFVIS